MVHCVELLIHHITPTSGSLQLCSEIIYNILIMPEFIQSRFKCAGSISRNDPVGYPIRKTEFS